MKPYLLLKKRHMAYVLAGVFLAAVVLVALTMSLPDLLAGASANAQRKLPIYCTDRADKVVSLTFDAAWGDAVSYTHLTFSLRFQNIVKIVAGNLHVTVVFAPHADITLRV